MDRANQTSNNSAAPRPLPTAGLRSWGSTPGRLFWSKEVIGIETGIHSKPEASWARWNGRDIAPFLNMAWSCRRPSYLDINTSVSRPRATVNDMTKFGVAARTMMEVHRDRIDIAQKQCIRATLEAIDKIKEAPYVTAAFLTGSIITGTFVEGSDVDITLLTPMTPRAIARRLLTCADVKTVKFNMQKKFLIAVKFHSGVSLDIATNNIDAVRSSHLMNSYAKSLDSYSGAILLLKKFGNLNNFKVNMKSYSLNLTLIYALEKRGILEPIFRHGEATIFNQAINVCSLNPFGIDFGIGPRRHELKLVLLAFFEYYLFDHDYNHAIQIHRDELMSKNNEVGMSVLEPFNKSEVLKNKSPEEASRFEKNFIAALCKGFLALKSTGRLSDVLTALAPEEMETYYAYFIMRDSSGSKLKKTRRTGSA